MTALAREVPAWLGGLLRRHRDRHGPHYGGGLSDHLPMALLAMHGLGAPRSEIEARHARYAQRLDPPGPVLAPAPADPAAAIGDLDSYGALIAFFDAEIDGRGVDGALARHLPGLMSGWVRHAFHPAIRLAYGIRFNLASEVAAGLAYLAGSGPDPRLEAAARNPGQSDRFSFRKLAAAEGRMFEHRYAAALASGRLDGAATVVSDNRRRVAEEALGVFASTGDFFALHMVTGCHAFLGCADAIGLEDDGLMNAGLLAANQAAGAPPYEAGAEPGPAAVDDEHDVKLAFTCADQAVRLGSERYRAAADVYRTGR